MHCVDRVVDADVPPCRGIWVRFLPFRKWRDPWSKRQDLALENVRAFWTDRVAAGSERPQQLERLRSDHLPLKAFDICSHAILVEHQSRMRNARQALEAQKHIEVVAPGPNPAAAFSGLL